MRLLVSMVLLCTACGGVITETLSSIPFDVGAVSSQVNVSATPAFADERGGGLFIDLAGRVVRLRADGTRAPLESHPTNAVAPGAATSIWPLGPYTALVVTERGLFVADGGWLIAPPWQARLSSDGFVASATGIEGISWIAHRDGLFRVESGELKELKANGESILDITALAIAPATDLRPGVWFAQGDVVSVASQTGVASFTIKDSGLTKEDVKGGVRGIAGIAASQGTGGEAWVITPKLLLQRTLVGWRRYELGKTPRQVMSAGRYLWLQSGDSLYRYDADQGVWNQARGLASVPTLLSVDAAGSAWVRVGEQTLSVAPPMPLRLSGVFHSQVVFDADAVLQLVVPTGIELESLEWRFDSQEPRGVDVRHGQEGAGPQAGFIFHSLGGVEKSGHVTPVSFAALEDGPHTLEVTTKGTDSRESKRVVYFDFLGSKAVQVSWARDVKPVNDSRCAKCHTTGTRPELATFEQWKANAKEIGAAVRDRRMPADGPLDAANMQLLQRWAAGGQLP